MIKLITSLAFLCFLFGAQSQSKVELSIEIITPDVISQATVNQDELVSWMKQVNAILEAQLKKEKGNHDIVMTTTVNRANDVEFYLSARPKMSEKVLKNLKNKILEIPSPHTKFADFSMLVVAQLNGGGTDSQTFEPNLVLPLDRKMTAYNQLPLVEKRDAIQAWMNEEILPLIGSLETKVDPRFEGVLSVGNSVQNEAYKTKPIAEITEKNSDYWRAVMEMNTGNQLILLTKMCMHISAGEFDRADRILFLLPYFSEEGTLALALYDEIHEKLGSLKSDIDAEINKGIQLYDSGKIDESITLYEKLLDIIPHSAWANYELYLSKSSSADMNMERVREIWEQSKDAIYASDPMYHIYPMMSTGQEAYEFSLRQDARQLFQTKDSLRADFVKYADIALDLKNYGIAAQLYWMILSNFSPEAYSDREIIEYFLYCLHKQGIDDLAANFKGDHEAAYARIEQERLQIMQNNDWYNRMQKN